MRRPGTSKQRLRLGAGRYRHGCRDTTTNAAATNAYAYSVGDAMRAWNANTYADSDSLGNTDGNRDTHCNRDSHSDCDATATATATATPTPTARRGRLRHRGLSQHRGVVLLRRLARKPFVVAGIADPGPASPTPATVVAGIGLSRP